MPLSAGFRTWAEAHSLPVHASLLRRRARLPTSWLAPASRRCTDGRIASSASSDAGGPRATLARSACPVPCGLATPAPRPSTWPVTSPPSPTSQLTVVLRGSRSSGARRIPPRRGAPDNPEPDDPDLWRSWSL